MSNYEEQTISPWEIYIGFVSMAVGFAAPSLFGFYIDFTQVSVSEVLLKLAFTVILFKLIGTFGIKKSSVNAKSITKGDYKHPLMYYVFTLFSVVVIPFLIGFLPVSVLVSL